MEPLLKTGLTLEGNVLRPLVKRVLIPLGLTAAVVAAIDEAIHKKMSKLFADFILTARIAKIYNKLYNTTSKLYISASSIDFIKKVLRHKVTPKFAKINGQFISKQDQIDAKQKLATLIAKQGDSYESSTYSAPFINLY